jgi:hypothetical protein
MNNINKLKKLITKNSNVVNASNDNARLSAIEEFGKCSEAQASLIVRTWIFLQKEYGKPDCVKYSGNKWLHVVGLEPFSLHCECIRFRLTSDLEGHQILIKLARSTTPGCNLRDPLLVYKYPDEHRPNRLIILNASQSISEFMLDVQYDEIGDFEIAPTSVPRKASTSGVMTFNEKEDLLPRFLSSIKETRFKHKTEYKHPHGSVDVYLKSSEKDVFVELKFVNKDENPIGKLRTAIGQILMYKNDPGITFDHCNMWVVTNKTNINKELKKTLEIVSRSTGIEFFQVHNKKLVSMLNLT